MTALASPETRTISGTVMFTDIVGFTEFTALRGDAEALALLALQERIVLNDNLEELRREYYGWADGAEPRLQRVHRVLRRA